jgi:hypothetical protein
VTNFPKKYSPTLGRGRVLSLLAPVLLIVGVLYMIEGSTLGCPIAKRIANPEAALTFGKNHIRKDRRFWESVGVSSPEELEGILNDGICSRAFRGDYFIKDPNRWGVYIAGKSSGRYDFDYEVFFGGCGQNARVEKQATRY